MKLILLHGTREGAVNCSGFVRGLGLMSARKALGFGSVAAVAQLVERKLPKLAGGRTGANQAQVPCLSQGETDLGSPGFVSVRHLVVRDSFGNSGAGR